MVSETGEDAEWWTTSDVAAYLGVQISTVTNYESVGRCQSLT
ncbi:hypothetical protein V2I01_14210 [Micromonospora sp. BRA006-A]|nr:hypothetical protein [Micromonospora sp. BRA006-A]